jgi:hypothetical protein
LPVDFLAAGLADFLAVVFLAMGGMKNRERYRSGRAGGCQRSRREDDRVIWL